MAERLVENKIPVVSGLADKTVTNEAIAIKLEMTATEWGILSALVTAVRQCRLHVNFCVQTLQSVSMVHPILNILVTHHLLSGTDDAVAILEFKDTVLNECITRFNLADNIIFVSARRIASSSIRGIKT